MINYIPNHDEELRRWCWYCKHKWILDATSSTNTPLPSDAPCAKCQLKPTNFESYYEEV